MPANTLITDVADTALWVAAYRAIESERSDALFQDPFASALAGKRGMEIAKGIANSDGSSWSVVVRTCIIDAYIQSAIQGGIDTILNLGAGLDARPYRMKLPESLNWIEVDVPKIIDHKESILKNEQPRCKLERFRLDLSDDSARHDFLSSIESRSKNVLVLTEGVVLYLKNADAARLAKDLSLQKTFRYWIVDYFSAKARKYVWNKTRKKQLASAPWHFEPRDWLTFFADQGWKPREMRYTVEESFRLGRKPPAPPMMNVLRFFISKKRAMELRQMAGYALMAKI